MNTLIEVVDAREILDSRGNPTIEVDVVLADGALGSRGGAVRRLHGRPRGGRAARRRQEPVRRQGRAASRRQRDRDDRAGAVRARRRRPGAGSTHCCANLDGTPNKATLGANAILGASLACAHAAAASYDLPLYRYLGGVGATNLPVPMFNILNGGKHAQDSTDFQEFMVMPVGSASFAEALRAGARGLLGAARHPPRRGPLRPARATKAASRRRCRRNEAAIEVILRAIERAGYRPGVDVAIALDPATTELVDPGSGADGAPTRYVLAREGRTLDLDELIDLWADWAARYPIVSLEDGLAEDDWAGWRTLTERARRDDPARR